jgi:hypothetical protein
VFVDSIVTIIAVGFVSGSTLIGETVLVRVYSGSKIPAPCPKTPDCVADHWRAEV